MKRLIFTALIAGALPFTACTKDFDNSTVSEFDLSRYLGEWYEIARYDHSFERGMDNTMAEYILQAALILALMLCGCGAEDAEQVQGG